MRALHGRAEEHGPRDGPFGWSCSQSANDQKRHPRGQGPSTQWATQSLESKPTAVLHRCAREGSCGGEYKKVDISSTHSERRPSGTGCEATGEAMEWGNAGRKAAMGWFATWAATV
eukprot:GGOE01027071.1.p4 GENE.GGOE01027071.1~~GGOE01027071.1.p4  ORF type:complete len:116 (+),score=3.92 GGOE01027071.1:329-676(+)